jgi:hypothetical protein
MPLYKVLRFGSDRYDSRGSVESEEERWDSLEAALRELSEVGWEIEMPIYNPVPGESRQAGAEWLEALLLVNHSLDASQELERQVDKAEEKLAEAKKEYDSSNEKSKKLEMKSKIKLIKDKLKGLRKKKRSEE